MKDQARYERAHDELDQYVELMADTLRTMSSPSGAASMLVYCLDQLDLDRADSTGEWYTTSAQRLEGTLDTARAACDDEYPVNPRAIASRVHLRMAGGQMPLPKRSRYGQWNSTGAGVMCTCGRSVWAWTLVEDQQPVQLGDVEWLWWRVCCRRCQLAIVLLFPDTELDRESMDTTHRAVVASFYTAGPGADIRWGTQDGEPCHNVHPARCGDESLPRVIGAPNE